MLCRERAQQKQAKQSAGEPSKHRPEAAAAQPAEIPIDTSSGSALVEDHLLPKSGTQPPTADPVGKGLLSAQELSGDSTAAPSIPLSLNMTRRCFV